ncbi:hypothetical protein TNCV_1203191 [Trichonephila clavipes]|nr:hypothetical protein TNCV_1203191 [Trichonephila clavipes]
MRHLFRWGLYRIGHLSATELEGVFYALFNSFKIGTYPLQWVPSHVCLPRNEVADDLANVAASNPVDLRTTWSLRRLRSTPELKI